MFSSNIHLNFWRMSPKRLNSFENRRSGGLWPFLVLNAHNSVAQMITLRCFQKTNQSIVCFISLYRSLYRLQIHSMGWLRLVGSFKLQVYFAKEPYKRDYILQKRPMISRSLLIKPPHTANCAKCTVQFQKNCDIFFSISPLCRVFYRLHIHSTANCAQCTQLFSKKI